MCRSAHVPCVLNDVEASVCACVRAGGGSRGCWLCMRARVAVWLCSCTVVWSVWGVVGVRVPVFARAWAGFGVVRDVCGGLHAVAHVTVCFQVSVV